MPQKVRPEGAHEVDGAAPDAGAKDCKQVVGSFEAVLVALVLVVRLRGHGAVDYNSEVRPILNARCISCHGGVKRSAGFGVLFREDALRHRLRDSGAGTIVMQPESTAILEPILDELPDLSGYGHVSSALGGKAVLAVPRERPEQPTAGAVPHLDGGVIAARGDPAVVSHRWRISDSRGA